MSQPDVDKWNLDPNITGLVKALLSIPGIHTFSSCGGHPRRTDGGLSNGQMPVGTFYVTFDVPRNAEGWKALALIQSAVQQTSEWCYRKLEMSAWMDPDNGDVEGLHFDIHGWKGADPDELAEEIRKRLPV
jgi:hypothetical protein